MIECYFRWCEHHYKDEPFCKLDKCVATKEQMMKFTELRKDDLTILVKKDTEGVL